MGSSWRPRFQLEPDIGVYRNQQIVCLIDAKWKSLDPTRAHCGVMQGDAYQMYAYGKEFSAPTTVMLYPRTGGLPAMVAEYRHHDNQIESAASRRVLVATVDVSQPLHRREIRDRFRTELARLVESIETATTTPLARP